MILNYLIKKTTTIDEDFDYYVFKGSFYFMVTDVDQPIYYIDSVNRTYMYMVMIVYLVTY